MGERSCIVDKIDGIDSENIDVAATIAVMNERLLTVCDDLKEVKDTLSGKDGLRGKVERQGTHVKIQWGILGGGLAALVAKLSGMF